MVPTSYVGSVKNVPEIFAAIRRGQAPEKFTQSFLEQLGFKSKNDRGVVGVMKSLGFLEASGAPTQRYFSYLDEGQSEVVMAEAIREAYNALFRLNIKANEMSSADVFNKLKTLTQGAKGESVLKKMSSTFVRLCELGDFESGLASGPPPVEPTETPTESAPDVATIARTVGLTYDIHIHLPQTRDQAVYDALFASLKRHLL